MNRLSATFLASVAIAPAAAAQPVLMQPAVSQARPPARTHTGFEGLFVDWSAASRQSIEAERQAVARPAASGGAASPAPMTAPGSVALGERVGDIVALGDCAEGERVARTAGDFALVAAVRDYCTAAGQSRR